MGIDVVQFTALGDNASFRDAIHKLDYTVDSVLKSVKWDERHTNNGAVVNFTGDGYLIGFNDFIHDEQILEFAKQCSIRLKDEGLSSSIGINKGYCMVYKDLNLRLNLGGWGIIDAQRVMSLGDKNLILISSS